MENPDGEAPGSLRALIFYLGDIFFTSLFTAELLLKVFVYGLYETPEAYLKSGWNILDATIVVTSLPSILIPGLDDLQFVRVLRALRALRPLVLIKRFKGLRQVVYSLGRALPKVARVAYVCILLTMVYALFGMALLMGTMQSCNDGVAPSAEACVGTFVDATGRERPRWWGNPDTGDFDSFGGAMLVRRSPCVLPRPRVPSPHGIPWRWAHLNTSTRISHTHFTPTTSHPHPLHTPSTR